MKKFFIFLTMVLLVWLMAACVFYPVAPQAEFEARETAQAQAVLPTVTPTPTPSVVPTIPFTPTAEVIPPTPVPDCTVKGNIDAKGK